MIFYVALYVPDAKPGRCTGHGGGREGTIDVNQKSRGGREAGKPVVVCRYQEDMEQGAFWENAADESRESNVLDPGKAEELDYNRGCFG